MTLRTQTADRIHARAGDRPFGHCGLDRGPEGPAAHVRIYLALLPSGPDAVRRLKLRRFRTAVQSATFHCTIRARWSRAYTGTLVASSRYFASTSPTMMVKKST